MIDGPATPALVGSGCTLCGATARVQWLRRLTADEVAEQQALEQARRDEILLNADPQLPVPTFPPMPDFADAVRAVYGCVNHAVGQDAAALIHGADCTAPDPKVLPHCNCTPEPAPAPDVDPDPLPLPAGWN